MQYIINDKGQVIFSATKTGWFEKGRGLCSVQVNGKWGYIDTGGKIVIPCVYDDVDQFENDVAIVMQGNKYGLINKGGKVIVPLQYSNPDSVPLPHEGKVCYNLGDNENRVYCCIDLNGNKLFTRKALVPFEFSDGLATVWRSDDKGYCVIDENGCIVIPAGKYDYVSKFHHGIAKVEKNNKYGFISQQGDIIVPIEYDNLYGDVFPVQAACVGTKRGYIDVRNGKVIFPISIRGNKDSVNEFLSSDNDNMVSITIDGGSYFYNLEDCTLIDCTIYKNVFRFSEGLCAVIDKITGKLGFINKKGNIAIPCVFDEPSYVYEFHGETCAMGHNFINKQGEIIFSIPQGDRISYHGGYYIWHNQYYEKLIELNGEIKYTGYQIEGLGGEFPVAIKKENKTGHEKWGFIDKTGKLVIPYQFNESYLFHSGFATINEPIRSTSRNISSGLRPSTPSSSGGGCYIATAVYGSYDCPEVWTLRRYRDFTLDKTWYSKAFIRTYYSISPILVKWFGKDIWFKRLMRRPLDCIIASLHSKGIDDTPYTDKH